MSDYVRRYEPDASYFFTVVTYERQRLFHLPQAREWLWECIAATRRQRPFEMNAFVLLPDHLHCIWTMGEDTDYSTRWRQIKSRFSQRVLRDAPELITRANTASRRKRQELPVWQRRFWEHMIRDESEFGAYLDYIHYNPVKHEFAAAPERWAWSSYGEYRAAGYYSDEWGSRPPQSLVRVRVPDD